jgi:hypothetical protein
MASGGAACHCPAVTFLSAFVAETLSAFTAICGTLPLATSWQLSAKNW